MRREKRRRCWIRPWFQRRVELRHYVRKILYHLSISWEYHRGYMMSSLPELCQESSNNIHGLGRLLNQNRNCPAHCAIYHLETTTSVWNLTSELLTIPSPCWYEKCARMINLSIIDEYDKKVISCPVTLKNDLRFLNNLLLDGTFLMHAVLVARVDADYKCIWVDAGGSGSASDAQLQYTTIQN